MCSEAGKKEKPERELGRVCLANNWRLAVAESCTGGLLGGRITSVSGSSVYFLGGIIAYSNEIKCVLLGVDRGLISQLGVVSEAVARSMAEGVATRFGADVGIAVTGVAGPDGSESKPPGTVYVAASLPGSTVARLLRISGERAGVREGAVVGAIGLFLDAAREGAC